MPSSSDVASTSGWTESSGPMLKGTFASSCHDRLCFLSFPFVESCRLLKVLNDVQKFRLLENLRKEGQLEIERRERGERE